MKRKSEYKQIISSLFLLFFPLRLENELKAESVSDPSSFRNLHRNMSVGGLKKTALKYTVNSA